MSGMWGARAGVYYAASGRVDGAVLGVRVWVAREGGGGRVGCRLEAVGWRMEGEALVVPVAGQGLVVRMPRSGWKLGRGGLQASQRVE